MPPAAAGMLEMMIDRNPELLKSLITSNPQVKAMMEKSSQFREALSDPGILKEMLKMSTNPAYYKEAMRNADRAMAQLENVPQGFQMLRQLHEQVREPALQSSASKVPIRSIISSTVSAKLQTAPLPNPWSPRAQPSSLPRLSTPVSAPVNPSEHYRTQLQELADMGFTDQQVCIRALIATSGNVQRAINFIVEEMDIMGGEESEDEMK
jgi:hypothetical protein